MGIRRRRKKVNTILTTIDRRLRSIELQRVPRVVKDGTITKKMLEKSVQIELAAASSSADDNPGTTTPQPPTFKEHPYTNIVKIVYTGYNETGTAKDRDRARVYFDTNPGLNVGDKIRFASVVGSLDVPAKTEAYTVKQVSVVDGYNTILYYPGRSTITDGSKTYDKGWRIRAANASVTGAIVDGTTTTYKYGQIILDGKDSTPTSIDDYKYGPTYPAGIDTTAGTHFTGGGFNVGDLLHIDGLSTLFDGTHKITSKTVVGKKITLQFEFKTYPTAPVELPSSNGAVRGAVGRFLRDGETYTDTTVDPPITWIWDEQRQRWWSAAATDLPPGVVVDDGIPPSPPTSLSGSSEGYVVGSTPYSRVNLTWSAPTTNSDGSNLSDLKGYIVLYRYSTSDAWQEGPETYTASASVEELQPERTVYFSVKAFDAARNVSTFSDSFSILTVAGTTGLAVPSAPVSASRLGQIRITWNGLDSAGATPPMNLIAYVEVHWSTTSGFTPGDTTRKGRLYGKNDFYADIDPVYGTNYYFKFVFVDIFGKTTAGSAQTLATVKPLVDTDMITGSLTRWPFGANTVDVASIANGSISATTLISGSDADGTAVRVEAKIAAGSIGATSIAANSIVAGKIATDAVTARTIKAGEVQAGKLSANSVIADNIQVGAIKGFKFDATTRIRLGNSTAPSWYDDASAAAYTPTNYIEFGYVTLPSSGVTAPGIIGQYAGAKTFYMGGWNDGVSSYGFSIGVMTSSSSSDVLTVGGYDNGLSYASNATLQAAFTNIKARGGNASDGWNTGAVTLSTVQGPIKLLSSGGTDNQGSYFGVYINTALMVGKTSTASWQTVEGTHITSGFVASANNGGNAFSMSRQTSNGTVCIFYRGTTTAVGSISVTTTGTAYNTTSDYRLKENILPIASPVEKLKMLRPRTFNFISDPDELVDGFIAHELAPVISTAVTGEKDAVDEDGEPSYQSVDHSKLVPILTGALQEAFDLIDSLSARIELLENK